MPAVIKNILLHTALLLLVVGLAFFWSNSALSPFTLQLASLITALYMVIQFLYRKGSFPKKFKSWADVVALTAIIYLLVFSSGALFSPVFFLIYFLLFGIALMFEPYAAYILAVVSSVFFLATPAKEIWAEFLQLSSLFLIAPLAQIFGTQHINLLKSKQTITALSQQEHQLEKEVRSQEEQVKHWTTQDFKTKLVKIWESIDALSANPDTTMSQKQKLGEVSEQLSNLLASGEKMQQKIEE